MPTEADVKNGPAGEEGQEEVTDRVVLSQGAFPQENVFGAWRAEKNHSSEKEEKNQSQTKTQVLPLGPPEEDLELSDGFSIVYKQT